MKIQIILNGSGGELDNKTITVANSDDADEAANIAIHEVVDNWRLSPGDSIEIKEVLP